MSRVPHLFAVCALVACGHGHTLVEVSVEPRGPNCENGGTVINTGVDKDRDGTLDHGEISSSHYVCNTASTVTCIGGENNVPGLVTLRDEPDFAQLADVDCVDGDIMIVGTALAEIPQLPNLRIVTGSLIVAGNPDLLSLEGLSNVSEVGRKYVVQGNDSLVDLAGLGALRRFQGLSIVGNDALQDVAGLLPLTELDGGLTISNNSSLTSLHGLENVTRHLRDRLVISTNKNLTSIAALANLRSSVLIEITGNASLGSITMPSLEKVDVYMLVRDQAALTSLSLPTLFSTGGLLVRANAALTSVEAPELVLSGGVAFEHNTSLGSVALPKLTYATGDFDLVNLPALTQLSFPALVSIDGRLMLNRLPVLSAMSGFTELSSVGSNFTLQLCAAVTDFIGFTKLVDVANMTITQNAQLTNFEGLEAFSKVGGDLTITSNPNVQRSTAQAFADSITVLGSVTIN